MPSYMAYGNSADSTLGALQTGLNIGDQIAHGPQDRADQLKMRQQDIRERDQKGQLNEYELRDKARMEGQQVEKKWIEDNYYNPDLPDIPMEEFQRHVYGAGMPATIGTHAMDKPYLDTVE